VKMALEPPRFDWYQGTVEMPSDHLIDLATTVLGDEHPVPAPARNGYARGWEIRKQGARSAVVFEGGLHEYPHITASGENAPPLANFLRGSTHRHRVSRADVCVDTDSPGAFKSLFKALRSISKEANLTATLMHNPDDGEAGATYYVGSKTSEVRARLYEKGKQLPEAERPHWVRFEVQARPQRERKSWTSQANEWDVLGSAQWSRRFAAETLSAASTAPPTRSERVSDLEGALRTLSAQYGRRMLELLEHHGGDVAAFGLELALRAENGGRLPEPAKGVI
jgi:hypothetical protein